MDDVRFAFPASEREYLEQLPMCMAVYQFYGGYYHMVLVTDMMKKVMRWDKDEWTNVIGVEIPLKLEVKLGGRKIFLDGESHSSDRAVSVLYYVVYHDTTETRKRFFSLKQRRRESKNLYNKILDTVYNGIFWKDEKRRFIGVNRAFLDFYGFPSQDYVLGKTDEELGWHPEPDKFKNDELRVLQGESTFLVHGKCMVRGKERDILASKAPLYENGRIIGLVGSFLDVTESYEQRRINEELNREKEIALLEAEHAKDVMSEFIMRASHEMRTPLNAILGFAQLAADVTDLDVMRDYMKKITISGNILTDLVNDILDIRKLDDGTMQLTPRPMILSDMLHDLDNMVSVLAEQKGITFVADIDSIQNEFIVCDKVRLEQIIMNLINNSIKFTDSGGKVSLNVVERQESAKLSEYTFVVSDTGCGMSEQFISRIFTPFAQENRDAAKYGVGTGLGLTITKRVVELMNGSISVKSEQDKGSVFTVKIPLLLSDIEEYGRSSVLNVSGAKAISLEGARLLIAEDNAINREVARGILEKQKVLVDFAVDGTECIEKFAGSERDYYQGILMDIHMPVMDGYEATKRIRSLDREDAPRIPIIAMTADIIDNTKRRALELGMNGYISKPIDVKALSRILATALMPQED